MDAYTMELMATEQRRDRLAEAEARRLLRSTLLNRGVRGAFSSAASTRPRLIRRIARFAWGL